ncbi:glycosyltransferase family 2 protein [Pontibacter liquoris]|uniref:glycosyltransferase family 2 protein n=1 Tax=Pontibacter liquoris TaxID=2905677 RepID=UPI001FA6E1DA|nr:glycosyltransferase family 2 protein [Pontibacter liquoris]
MSAAPESAYFPIVSVIIPVYNSQHILSDSIKSVLSQTYSNIELIIVDDSSTDQSYAIAKAFESDRCRIIRQKNAGAAAARNTGLANATGKYIQFLDVDDFLSEDKIEKQVEALKRQPNKVAVCDHIDFFNEEELLNKSRKVDQSSYIYSTDYPANFLINLYGGYGKPHFIQTNSWLVPRHLIDKAGGWRNYRCPDDDGEFFTRVVLASEGVLHVPGVYNYYRRSLREASLSQKTGKNYLQNTLLTIDLKHSYLLKKTNTSELRKAIATQYLNFAVSSYPKHRVLSKIALRRYNALDTNAALPTLGGGLIEVIKHTLGWKAARLVKYYLREER